MENLDNKSALKNAGFKEIEGNTTNLWGWMALDNPNGTFKWIAVSVATDTESLLFNVHKNKGDMPIYKGKANDIQDLKNKLYGFLDYHLDYSEKKTYDWETISNDLTVVDHNKVVNAEIALNELSKSGIISKDEAQSMMAKLKLNIIIQQINKDYPHRPKQTTGGAIVYNNGKLKVSYFSGEALYNHKITTATHEGAKILLDQDFELLEQLFRIKPESPKQQS